MAKTEVDIRRIALDFVRYLEPRLRVQKVILFGSYAQGKADEYSDIDLAIISDDFQGMDKSERRRLLLELRRSCNADLSPLGYTIQEYDTASPLTFLGEIKRTGVVIYQAE